MNRTMKTSAHSETLNKAALYLDDDGNPCQEHQMVVCRLTGASHTQLDGDVDIDAHTSDSTLHDLAQRIAPEDNDLRDHLVEIRAACRANDSTWGELSPHLDNLLEEGHPNVRLKTAGKYNPNARRIVLIRTRPGDGGWEPASLNDGDKAWAQWKGAGLTYPFAQERSTARTADMARNLQERIERQAEEQSRSSVTEALGIKRRYEREIASLQEKVRALIPVIREENLRETEIHVEEYRLALSDGLPVTGGLKIRKALIDLALKAIMADGDVDPSSESYTPFARTARLVELGIGADAAQAQQDDTKLCEAARYTRALLMYLRDDELSSQLRGILDRALALAEGHDAD